MDNEGTVKVSFDTDCTVNELIEKLASLQKESPLGKEFLAIYNENGDPCDGGSKVTESLSEAKTLHFDYKDHVVLQFTQIDNNEPVFKFKFVAYDEACQGKKKTKETLTGKVVKEDVITAKMETDIGEKASANKFFNHLKFYWKSANITSRFAANFITKGACMNSIIRVVMDAFNEKHLHYVITMEDNWIAKEYMSAAYNPAYLLPGENAKNKNKFLPEKDNYEWEPTQEEKEL